MTISEDPLLDDRVMTVALDGERHVVIRLDSIRGTLAERRLKIPDELVSDGKVRALISWVIAEMQKIKDDTAN